MLKKVFSIFDEKAEAYLNPFYLDTTGLAIRAITDCVNDPNHQFARHPADYTLFQLGEWDDTTGHFNADKRPLGSLIEYKAKGE